MDHLVFAWPIRPGKSEVWRRFIQEVHGSRCAAHAESRRRMGIVLERAWIIPTRRGDVVVLNLLTTSPELTLARLAGSALPFDRWFRQRLLDVHELDIAEAGGILPGEEVFTWQEESSVLS